MSKKKVLVTAGSTRVMIDQVRCISNIFGGKTGEVIARAFGDSCCDVTLLTSAKESYVRDKIKYNTYDELYDNMEKLIKTGDFDVVIHSAAVSDYKISGIFEIYNQECFGGESIGVAKKFSLSKIDSSTKVSSSSPELFLKLVPTEKIVDKIRDEWGFEGTLVKFKLQVGISDQELVDIAYKSMVHSKADLIVANCLEWSADRAFILNTGRFNNMEIEEVERRQLAPALVKRIGTTRFSQ